MKIAEAKRQLEAVGYHVEYTTGNANVYVRVTPSSYPTTLGERGGEVSDRSVKALLKFKGAAK